MDEQSQLIFRIINVATNPNLDRHEFAVQKDWVSATYTRQKYCDQLKTTRFDYYEIMKRVNYLKSEGLIIELNQTECYKVTEKGANYADK